jgi:DNA-binding response OmpR family regulator
LRLIKTHPPPRKAKHESGPSSCLPIACRINSVFVPGIIMPNAKPLAVVIEPRSGLAGTLAEALHAKGFEVMVASTHAGAANLVVAQARVDFLIAAVPAPGEDRSGAYLEVARAQNPDLAVVIMLSDPNEKIDGAPAAAVRLVKPFDRTQLEAAILEAMQAR